MTVLRAQGLSYSVATADLVRDVDLELHPGELVVVAGPNGAGKTTLLRLLAVDLAPTSGFVEIEGRNGEALDRAELAAARSLLGQGRTAGIPFSVADVVAMGGWARQVGDDEVGAALDAMDLGALSQRTVASLSSGEHTRVELARILTQDTPILLLDEPLTALDVAHQERVMKHLRQLTDSGRAVLVVLHDLNVAAAYANRLVLLRDGSVVGEGTPNDVLEPAVLSDLYGHGMKVVAVDGRPVVLPEDS